MQLANAWVILDKKGSNVLVRGMTPAELVLIVKDRQDFVGRHPVHNLEIVKESSRGDSLEKERLRAKYGPTREDRKTYKVDKLYPGEGAKLPQKFEDVGDAFTASLDKMLATPRPDISPISEDEISKLDQEIDAEDPAPVLTTDV